jgi:hypothetical protein
MWIYIDTIYNVDDVCVDVALSIIRRRGTVDKLNHHKRVHQAGFTKRDW